MSERRMPNPKVLLVVVAAIGFLLSMLAIYVAVSMTPGSTPSAPVTTTETSPSRPPPLILPPPMLPVPCAATSSLECADTPADTPVSTPAP